VARIFSPFFEANAQYNFTVILAQRIQDQENFKSDFNSTVQKDSFIFYILSIIIGFVVFMIIIQGLILLFVKLKILNPIIQMTQLVKNKDREGLENSENYNADRQSINEIKALQSIFN